MMRVSAIACALFVLLAATAAADELPVSQATLDSMGLATMQRLPDSDGAAVRGQGVGAAVWGGSLANWGGLSSSSNSYFASSSWNGPVGSSAFGNSLSFGGAFQFGQFSF